MDMNLMKLLLTWGSKMGVGSTLLVFVAVGLFSFAPAIIDSYNAKQSINGADTHLDVIQKVYYYNESITDGLRTILLTYQPQTDSNRETIILKTRERIGIGLPIPIAEMNRMPYCLSGTGSWYIDTLDHKELERQVVDLMTLTTMTVDEKLDLIEQVLRSYERATTDQLRKHLGGIEQCA